jgi:GNAT superfamily N-acetyltransferase
MSKTDDVGVRLAEAADRDKIWPLARAFATTYELDQGRYNASFQQLVAEPNALLIIAHTPVTDIVGYLLAFTHQTFLANGPVTWIEEVMVAEEVRRRGIGHNLMVAAEHWSASKSAAYVALATRRASDFYLALGYTESAAYFRKLVRAREQTSPVAKFAPSPRGQLKLTQPWLQRRRPGGGRRRSGQRSHPDRLDVWDMAPAPRRQVLVAKNSAELEPC